MTGEAARTCLVLALAVGAACCEATGDGSEHRDPAVEGAESAPPARVDPPR